MNVYELTDEQKEKILSIWRKNPKTSLKELTNRLFPGENLDGRSLQGKAITKHLSTLNIKPKTTKFEARTPIEFNDHQIEFMRNNYPDMSPHDITRVLFPDLKIVTPLIFEYKNVVSYIKNIIEPSMNMAEHPKWNLEGCFKPPRTITEALSKINQYTTSKLDRKALSAKEKEGAEALIVSLAAPRFVQTVNKYETEDEKEMFIASFVTSTYDKPDLTSDEINLYINLCADYVYQNNIQSLLTSLNRRLTEINDDPEGKISMSLTDAIKQTQKDYNDCLGRQEKLIKALNGSRGDRLKNKKDDSKSLKALIEWYRDEKNRKVIADLENKRREARAGVIQQIDSMDAMFAEIWGGIPAKT